MITVTLKKLVTMRCYTQCEEFDTLMTYMGTNWDTLDDTEISLAEIARLTSIEYAIDCSEATTELHKTWRKFGLWCVEPVAFLISIPSCRIAYETSIKFINDEVTFDELKKKQYLAACEHTSHTEENYDGVNFSADQMAVNFAEPNFYECVYSCYNHYAEAMKILGYSFDSAKNKINKKFLEAIS
jgi:hypothetical protein